MKFALEFVASFCTAIFAGASLYINLVEHPARMECGPALASAEFGPSYRRATVMQASLAVVAFLTAMSAWWLHAGLAWLVAGILIATVVPFTLVAIFPTNKNFSIRRWIRTRSWLGLCFRSGEGCMGCERC